MITNDMQMYAAPAVTLANQIASNGSRNTVLVVKGTAMNVLSEVSDSFLYIRWIREVFS